MFSTQVSDVLFALEVDLLFGAYGLCTAAPLEVSSLRFFFSFRRICSRVKLIDCAAVDGDDDEDYESEFSSQEGVRPSVAQRGNLYSQETMKPK